jgi:hypothetical protein
VGDSPHTGTVGLQQRVGSSKAVSRVAGKAGVGGWQDGWMLGYDLRVSRLCGVGHVSR